MNQSASQCYIALSTNSYTDSALQNRNQNHYFANDFKLNIFPNKLKSK